MEIAALENPLDRRDDFASWLLPEGCDKPISTNQGSIDLPFQRWFRFKEAFSPRFVAESISMSRIPVRRLCDPFGGSGTTALCAQFAGIFPSTLELNPFMADVIRSKLTVHDPRVVAEAVEWVVSRSRKVEVDVAVLLAGAPGTLVEPGRPGEGRWVLNANVADEILRLRESIEEAPFDGATRRLMKVVLGSRIVPFSNVVINGKGRRYRGGWRDRLHEDGAVSDSFEAEMAEVLRDLRDCGDRREDGFHFVEGDARSRTAELLGEGASDMALFSPPYPNSFDYVDTLNLQLWILGYLRSGADNRTLRNATLRSHVQIGRDHPLPAGSSPILDRTLSALSDVRKRLWHPQIPEMVGGYFGDMESVLAQLRDVVVPGGSVVIVAGDSRYAGIHVPVTEVLADLAGDLGFDVLERRTLRSMRASPQQGGQHALPETILHLGRGR